MEIGEVIKVMIKKRGYSQIYVAEKIGKSPTALSQIIKGVYKPQSDTLEKIGEVLNIPVPVFHFLSIDENSVPKENLQLFRTLKPTMERYLIDVFNVEKKDLEKAL